MKTYPHENEQELRNAGIIRIPRPTPAMRCTICNATDDQDHAIDAGWVPSYWEGEEEIEGPVCCDCATAYLRVGADGEMESFDRWATN